jgi:putative nucleotide binding protein
MVHENPQKFVDFFNTAQPLTTRMHQLELLPGVGKKHMWEIIDARDENPFDTFEDIKKRVKLMPDPEKAIIKRIMEELSGSEKHRLFVDVHERAF